MASTMSKGALVISFLVMSFALQVSGQGPEKAPVMAPAGAPTYAPEYAPAMAPLAPPMYAPENAPAMAPMAPPALTPETSPVSTPAPGAAAMAPGPSPIASGAARNVVGVGSVVGLAAAFLF